MQKNGKNLQEKDLAMHKMTKATQERDEALQKVTTLCRRATRPCHIS